MLTEPAQVKPAETRSASAQPKLIYKPFAQKLTFICKFCGGKSCKHENWLTHPTSAIKGLNSDWVTSNILATQRPSTRINREFNIIQAFKDNDINAIFNLQEPGEHPFCGDGIHEQSGFSYFPEEFYEHGIYFFNFGWKDMTATSTDVIIKILKQMSFSLADGHKIAIHCHAGRGRTGLMIAAWLIYNHHMTAKEAINIVRSKRKGSIQSKSQEQVLFRLEKELKESRIIFHASAKFKLEDFLFHQKKILPLSDQSETRFVPNLVLLSLERLETLMTSGLATSRDIALAFSSPNDATYFKGEWNANHEKALKSLKEQINTGSFKISEIDDPRYLAQGLLDYFDHFASPAIRNQFIDVVHSQIHNQDKLTREMKDKFFKQVDRKEFLLIECFAKFFSKLIDKDESIIEFVKRAVFRVCISLVLERKKWDKLFLKRSLIKDHHADDKVSHLHIFVLKWVENFNKSFTDHFIVSTSPLKISEQRVLQKMDRVSRKHGTYLGRALNPHGDGSDRSSPTFSQGDFSPLKPNGTEQGISTGTFPPINNQQIDQQTGKPTDPRSHSPDFNANPAYLPLIPLGRNNRNASPGSDNLSSMVHSNGELLPDSINMNSEPGSKHQTVLSPIQIRGQSSSYSPSKNRSKTTIVKTSSPQPRVSLLEGHENLFVGESNLGDSTLKKNYDKFFSDNALFSVDTPREKMEDVSEESEGSELSDRENFMGLVEEIDRLSLKKKQMILEKLVREIQAENALTS